MRHDIAQKECRGSCFYHNPPPLPSVNVGVWHWLLTTWLVSTLNWGKGGYFSLESGKTCAKIFSMIVAS